MNLLWIGIVGEHESKQNCWKMPVTGAGQISTIR